MMLDFGLNSFAPPLLGFGLIWAIVPGMTLLPTSEETFLSLFFPINVKKDILDL
jgi:hypothetical protein